MSGPTDQIGWDKDPARALGEPFKNSCARVVRKFHRNFLVPNEESSIRAYQASLQMYLVHINGTYNSKHDRSPVAPWYTGAESGDGRCSADIKNV